MLRMSTTVVGFVFAAALAVRLFGLLYIERILPANILFFMFSLGNVHLLDHVSGAGSNTSATEQVDSNDAWLFRTGSPAVFGSFAAVRAETPSIDVLALRAQLQAVAPDMPASEVELIDFCLLGGPSGSFLEREDFMVNTEESFFADHPEDGIFLHRPMPGLEPEHMLAACDASSIPSQRCPAETRQLRDVSDAERKRLAEGFATWDPNGLIHRVHELHALLHDSSARRPRAVFFHCQCGCDRTGMVAAAYAMMYRGLDFKTAMAENVAVAGRPMYYPYQVNLQWFCEWMRSTGQYAGDDCHRCQQQGMLCQQEMLRPDKWVVQFSNATVLACGAAFALAWFLLRSLGKPQLLVHERDFASPAPPGSPPRCYDDKPGRSPAVRTPETPDPPMLGGTYGLGTAFKHGASKPLLGHQ